MTFDFFKSTVLKEELKVLEKSGEDDLIGLSFSGGGERSATLNLGVLQAFAEYDILKSFDYLSTVSGGGYSGAFFSSIIHRNNGNLGKISNELKASLRENANGQQSWSVSNGIFHLRTYSNYLTPKSGLFTTDTLAAVAQWLSNTLLNQVLLTSLVLIIFIIINWLNSLNNPFIKWDGNIALYFGGFIVLLSATLGYLSSTKKKFSLSWKVIYSIGFLGVVLIALGIKNNEMIKKHPEFDQNFFDTNVTLGVGIPFLTMIVSLLIILTLGFCGRKMSPQNREWWHRLGGINIAVSVVWIATFAFAVYIPAYICTNFTPAKSSFFGAFSYLVTFLTAKFGQSSLSGGRDSSVISRGVSAALPYLVIILICISLGYVSHLIYMSSPTTLCIWLAILIGITVAGNLRFDINLFSLHNFYRNRLTRCYLGASNPRRHPSKFTGFDENDDIPFSQLGNQKPYHIINTALNISNGKELAWQERKAASFMFTPKYCGFQLPIYEKDIFVNGFAETHDYSDEKGPLLGSLIAVSGAAASPNSGYHTNPVMGIIMTIFNARLGRWFGNPAGKYPKRSNPEWNLMYLIKELFTNTDASSDYLYLSDGGHFENLGIYELVRRECSLIVSIDAGQDGDYQFEDLGNAIRKCKADFSADIAIDIVNLIPVTPSFYGDFKVSKAHYAIGEIRYVNDKTGILLYIKSSLTGDEPTDLINYKLQEPTFPHHSTVDQFFDESQFESYRCLGAHMASIVMGELSAPSAPKLSKQIYSLLT